MKDGSYSLIVNYLYKVNIGADFLLEVHFLRYEKIYFTSIQILCIKNCRQFLVC